VIETAPLIRQNLSIQKTTGGINMKKIIFSLFLISLLFATPCFAQMKTERFIMPNGTLWKVISHYEDFNIGFFQGGIWFCDDLGSYCLEWQASSSYLNFIYSPFKAELWLYYGISLSGYTIPLLKRGKVEVCLSYEGCETFDLRLTSNFWSPN